MFNTPLSVYGTSGFLGMSQTERPVLRTPEQVYDFLSQFGTIEMWEVDDHYTSGEKVLRFFLTPRLRDVLGAAAHIVREINATGFKACLFDAGLLPLYNLATALRAIAESPRFMRSARRVIDARIARVRASQYPPHAVRAYTRAMMALAERWVPDDFEIRTADALCRALLDGMENARRGRRLPHTDDQARVLRLALNVATAPFVPIVQRCADEFSRG